MPERHPKVAGKRVNQNTEIDKVFGQAIQTGKTSRSDFSPGSCFSS
jgi:hypothetical protein